jgi:hypothetical protein
VAAINGRAGNAEAEAPVVRADADDWAALASRAGVVPRVLPLRGAVATPKVSAPDLDTHDETPADETSVDRRGADGIRLGSGGPGAEDVAPVTVPKRGFVRRAILPVSVAAAAAFVAATGYLAVTDPPLTSDIGRWRATGTAVVQQPVGQPVGQSAEPSAEPSVGLSASGPAGAANVDPFGPAPSVLRGAPTRLRVKAIGVDTTLESLHLGKGGALTPPKNFAKAGWYSDGTAPGDLGPAVIAGHVDSKRGPAIFYKLRELEAGDRIEVVRGGKTVRFTVVSTAWYPKTKFPTEQVYGPTPDRQLRLITCGGVFNHTLRSYKDNLVVYAVAG